MLKEVEGVWHEHFGGAFPTEGFARAGVELPGNGIEFGLRESREVGALGERLTEQSVGVLVDTALPRAVGIGEADGDASDFGKPLVLRHLAPLIVSQGKASLRVNTVEDSAKAHDGRVGTRVVHLGQGHEQRGSFNQGANGRRVTGALDQIALPVAGNDAFVDLRWALMDAGHMGDRAPAIFAPGARPATLARLVQAGDQLGAQRAARHGVKRSAV